jgi:phage repressor protein C with HTH and peptisase S24 domain
MFSDLLKKYRLKSGLKQKDITKMLNDLLDTNIKLATYSTWENGTNPKIEVIQAIAEILEIPEQYLFDDRDNIVNKIISDKMPSLRDMSQNTSKIQLYDGLCGAGSGGILYNTTDNFMYIDSSLINRKYQNQPIIALKIIGDSMEPYIYEDDIILVSILKKMENKPTIDGKYIINTMAGTMLKNLTFRSNGDIVISSCNKAHPPEIINVKESQEVLDIIGIPVGRILKS